MDALMKELAAALAKVRKQYAIMKFEDSFYETSEMSFQSLPGSDQMLAYIQKDNTVVPGVPFRWEGPIALDCPELVIFRPKSCTDVYVLTPDFTFEEGLLHEEVTFALELVPNGSFPFEVGGIQYSREQMAFDHVPELEEMLLANPAMSELKFDGLPRILSLISEGEQHQTTLIAYGSQVDGRLYLLRPKSFI